jgi:hypothetical protein
MPDLKIGLIVGREWSFPPKFIGEVNRRNAGVTAEFVQLGGTRMDEPCEYAVIIDRISHEVPYYRTYLKHAVLQGATVVNNPFMWTADDKFFDAGLATKLGIASPKTVVLPNREYIPGIKHDESLRNLRYPLEWEAVVDYVGMPCVLKDALGGGWRDVFVCRSMDDLIRNYDSSGLLTMVLQEFIEWDHFVRCIALGQREVLPMKYDPRERRYHVEHQHMSAELGRRVVEDSLTLMCALGYDMCSLEWAVRDGVPYAIDFMNPAPDMDIYSLTPHYFEWVVTHMADMAIELAHERRPASDMRRGEFLLGRRLPPTAPGAAARASTGEAVRQAVAVLMEEPAIAAAPGADTVHDGAPAADAARAEGARAEGPRDAAGDERSREAGARMEAPGAGGEDGSMMGEGGAGKKKGGTKSKKAG